MFFEYRPNGRPLSSQGLWQLGRLGTRSRRSNKPALRKVQVFRLLLEQLRAQGVAEEVL